MRTAEFDGLCQFLSGAAFRRIKPAGGCGWLIIRLLSNRPRFLWLLLNADGTRAKVLEIVLILVGIFPGSELAWRPGSIHWQEPPRRF